LRHVTTVFEDLGVTYMIGGSQASVYYGESRFAQDIDVVTDLKPEHIPALVDRFPAGEFYLSVEAAREAVGTRGQLDIVHAESALKIDVFVNKDTDYDRLRLDRCQRLPLVPGPEAYFARPEDIILYKMLYFRRASRTCTCGTSSESSGCQGPRSTLRTSQSGQDGWASTRSGTRCSRGHRQND
jgi:hypothetical protein